MEKKQKFTVYDMVVVGLMAAVVYVATTLRVEIPTPMGKTMIHMASKHYIPAAITYTTRLGQSISSVSEACPGADLSVQKDLLTKVSAHLANASAALEQLKILSAHVDAMDNMAEMARAYHDQIVPAMAALRVPVDELELLVDKDIWPVPTYGDLMFEV